MVEKEKEIMRVKALNSGKPEKIIDKIIEGQINKFYGEVCLLEQAFVMDTDLQVAKLVANVGKDRITSYNVCYTKLLRLREQ